MGETIMPLGNDTADFKRTDGTFKGLGAFKGLGTTGERRGKKARMSGEITSGTLRGSLCYIGLVFRGDVLNSGFGNESTYRFVLGRRGNGWVGVSSMNRQVAIAIIGSCRFRIGLAAGFSVLRPSSHIRGGPVR
jgi:hypothetical protein